MDTDAKQALHAALAVSESSVQHAAVHAISVMRDEGAFTALVPLLKSSDAQVRRATAEALGRLGNHEAVKPLLEAAARLTTDPNAPATSNEKYPTPDRILEHSITYALIEMNAPAETRAGLAADMDPLTKRAALIALDQMDTGDLQPQEVTSYLDSTAHPLVNQAANWIIAHRKDWSVPVAAHLRGQVKNVKSLSPSEKAQLETQLQSLGSARPVQEMLEVVSLDPSAGRESRLFALESLRRARPKTLADPMFLLTLFRSNDAELVQGAAGVAGAASVKGNVGEILQGELLRVAAKQQFPPVTRLEALNAAAGTTLDGDLFGFVRANLAPNVALNLRTLAVSVIGKAKLTDDQLVELADVLKAAGPLEIGRLVDAFEKSSSERVGHALLTNLRDARGLSGVHPDRLKQVLAKYPDNVRDQARDILSTLNEDGAKQAAYIDSLLPKLKDGDIRRGQAIFNSTRAACSGCHAIGYLGGNLGPDLTKIGQVRTERDLLEAIVYPSASFVRSYEPVIVTTKSGDDFSGVLRKDAADEVILGTGPNADVRLARSDIGGMRPGKVSVMPQGLNEQLTQQELADLLAFLKATRW
jgi:putative heme-binding domain-containing protein